jgi:hypothetical protein
VAGAPAAFGIAAVLCGSGTFALLRKRPSQSQSPQTTSFDE